MLMVTLWINGESICSSRAHVRHGLAETVSTSRARGVSETRSCARANASLALTGDGRSGESGSVFAENQ